MSFEPVEPTFGQTSVADASRVVTIQRIKKLSMMSTACNVGGTLCFIPASAQKSWLRRIFGLAAPESLTDDIVVFGLSGLNGLAFNALKRDPDFVKAVAMLLGMGTRLTLQNHQLTLTVGNGHVKNSQPALSAGIGIAAARLEALGVPALNENSNLVRLARPYQWYGLANGIVFGLCFALIAPSLAPLLMALRSLELGGLLTVIVAGVLLPWHLRKSPLGGAIVSSALTSAVVGSLLLGSSVAMLANTFLGERLEHAQDVDLTGTVAVTHGRHTSCWLYLDHPASNLVPGISLGRLPLQCREVHFHADPESHLYDLTVNPGLLGVPFIQSMHVVDSPPLPAYLPPVHPQFYAPAAPPTSASMPFVVKLARRIEPQLTWHDTSGRRWKTTVAIHCAPDGKLLSAAITKSSGNAVWDTTVLRAIQNSDPLPVDNNGKTPEHFSIGVQSKGTF